MTFMQSVLKRIEQRKKNSRKRLIEAKTSNIGFTTVQRTLGVAKVYSNTIKKRVTTKAQFKKMSCYKSAGLKLGREGK